MVEFLAFVFVICALMMLAGRIIQNSIGFLALQSLSLSVLAFYFAFSSGGTADWHMLVVGFLTFAIKVVILPYVLFKIVDRVKADRVIPVSVGPVTSVLSGVVIVAVTYAMVVPELQQHVQVGGPLLGAALATILLGCFYMVTRRSVISQLIGVIVIENGVFLSALAIMGGMPLFIELGIFFDLLVGALVMGVITFKIQDNFDTLDTKELNRLKG